MKSKITFVLALLITVISFSQNTINYKAIVKDAAGNILANQALTMQFTILENATTVYSELQHPTTDANGLIIVSIGDGILVFGNYSTIEWGANDHFLKVEMADGMGGALDLGTTKFNAVPYALSSSDSYWSKNGTKIYNLTDNVGMGTNNPLARLSVSGTNAGVYAIANATNAVAMEAYSSSFSGNTIGVDVTVNSPDGIGVYSVGPKYAVYGFASAANASGIGLRGRATGSTSKGVEGVSTGSSGIGVYGEGVRGVYGVSNSNTGTAIEAYSTSPTGNTIALDATANSPDGIGVYAVGPKYAVYGFSSAANSDGRGVRGRATGATGQGLRGEANGESGKAIYGEATGLYGKGIHAKVTSTNSSANGILAESGGGSSYAGYFVGRVHVAGVLSKSSGSFKIDHPQDPENKYLSHSFVESPDMMNIYNGNVVTDNAGNAIVSLPDYFEALNIDFRYQLTVIGEFAQAIISQKIKANSFQIKTNKPNVEVSWQVTGVRNDAFARKNRIQVVEQKEAENIGTYLNPEVFDQTQ